MQAYKEKGVMFLVGFCVACTLFFFRGSRSASGQPAESL
jgi:hypothetical protein